MLKLGHHPQDRHVRRHPHKKGQIVIPADIRARYELTAGTQVEFVDEGGVIRLVVRRRVARTDPRLVSGSSG